MRYQYTRRNFFAQKSVWRWTFLLGGLTSKIQFWPIQSPILVQILTSNLFSSYMDQYQKSNNLKMNPNQIWALESLKVDDKFSREIECAKIGFSKSIIWEWMASDFERGWNTRFRLLVKLTHHQQRMTNQPIRVSATNQFSYTYESLVSCLQLIFEIYSGKFCYGCLPLIKSWPSRQTSLHFEFCQTVFSLTALSHDHLSALSASSNDCKSHWAELIYVISLEKFIKFYGISESSGFVTRMPTGSLQKTSIKSKVN